MFRGDQPIRLCQNGGKYVGQIQNASEEEDHLHLAVSSSNNQHPNDDGCDRHGDIFADPKNLHGCCHTSELRHHVRQVHKKAHDHYEKGGPEPEFLANQIGESFPRHHAHPRAHLFRDVQRDGHGNERPEQSVAVLRSCLRIDGNSARVVVHIGRDQPRPYHRQQQRQTPAQPTDLLLQIRVARPHAIKLRRNCVPVHRWARNPFLFLHQPRHHVVHGDGSNRSVLFINYCQHPQVVLVEKLEDLLVVRVWREAEQGLGLQLCHALIGGRQKEPRNRDGTRKLRRTVQQNDGVQLVKVQLLSSHPLQNFLPRCPLTYKCEIRVHHAAGRRGIEFQQFAHLVSFLARHLIQKFFGSFPGQVRQKVGRRVRGHFFQNICRLLRI